MTCARAVTLEHQRRRPGVDLVAGLAPDFLAGARVERRDEGAGGVIPHDDQAVAEQGGVLPSPNWLRMRLSPRSVCHSGVPFMSYAYRPRDSNGAIRISPFGDGGARCPGAVFGVRRLVRRLFAGGALPGDLAGGRSIAITTKRCSVGDGATRRV